MDVTSRERTQKEIRSQTLTVPESYLFVGYFVCFFLERIQICVNIYKSKFTRFAHRYK
jgi:hypothetical protein